MKKDAGNIVVRNVALIKECLEENTFGERDNDVQLYISLCRKKGMPIEFISAVELIQGMNGSKYPYMASVTRVRAMLQQRYPHLRGTLYEERISHRRYKVKQEINTFKYDSVGQSSFGEVLQ